MLLNIGDLHHMESFNFVSNAIQVVSLVYVFFLFH